jgi:hypothetical protein
MGREVVVAITNGKLDFGPWEQIFYGDFDGRRRKTCAGKNHWRLSSRRIGDNERRRRTQPDYWLSIDRVPLSAPTARLQTSLG